MSGNTRLDRMAEHTRQLLAELEGFDRRDQTFMNRVIGRRDGLVRLKDTLLDLIEAGDKVVSLMEENRTLRRRLGEFAREVAERPEGPDTVSAEEPADISGEEDLF